MSYRRRAEEIRRTARARVEYAIADMTRRDEVLRLADAAVAALGKIDILVNNAGANLPQPIDEVRDDDWDRLLELNLTSCMALTRALVPGMKERRWGRIIHISSIMGLASTAGRNAYSATKSALLGLARAERHGPGPVQHHRQLPRPGAVRHRHAHVDSQSEQQAAWRPHARWTVGGGPRSWPAPPCSWPARPAATSPAPCWWSTAGRWPRCFERGGRAGMLACERPPRRQSSFPKESPSGSPRSWRRP